MDLSRPVQSLSNNTLCKAQGVLYTFFTNASFYWTVALSIQLYTIIKYSKPYFSEFSMQMIFWGIPLVYSVVPFFSGTTYGMDDIFPEFAVFACAVRNGEYTAATLTTQLITLQISKYIAIIIIGVMYYLTKKEVHMNQRDSAFYEVASIMGLYPLVFCFCWLPLNLFYNVIIFLKNPDLHTALIITTIATAFQVLVGVFVPLIYFYGSKQARDKWYTLLTQCTTNAVVPLLETRTYIDTTHSASQALSRSMKFSVYYNDLEAAYVKDIQTDDEATNNSESKL